MRKSLILTMIALAAAATATAEILTPARALERALGSAPAGVRKAAAMKVPALRPSLTVGTTDAPEVYIMTPTAESLLIVSAESETPALLGYADTAFDPANIPPAMAAMLETYSEEIKAVRAGIATAATGSRADMAPVLPLCQTTWNQDKPYNYYCPRLNGELCMTGCVATAMGQVLKALEWPAKCNGGSETYNWGNGGQNLTLNFDNVDLAWSMMKNNFASSSTTASSKAVATLLQALGYAGHMNYSPTASGTHGVTMAGGLINHFDYDCTLSYELHDWYTQDEWESMIHAELAKGIPVYCDGVNSDYSMGHAFVVDGYQGDGFFHLNWGWGGLSDGYYRMTALDPISQGIGGSSGGYNFAQGIIVGLKKGSTTPVEERPLSFYCYNSFGVTAQSVTKGKQATFTGGFYNVSPLAVKNVSPGVKFVNESTGEELYYRTSSAITQLLQPNYGLDDFSVSLPKSLPEGTYTVSPVIYDRNAKKYYDMHTRIGGYGLLSASVTADAVTFDLPARAAVKTKGLKLTSNPYVGAPFTATATVTNPGSIPYNGYVIPVLFKTNGAVAQAFEMIAVEIGPGQSIDINMLCPVATSIPAGTYDFVLIGENGKQSGSGVRVAFTERPAAGVMTLNSLNVTNTAKNNLTFEVTSTCSEGFYSEPVFVVILRKSGTGNYLDYFMSTPALVSAGESKTIEISGTFAGGNPGTTYSAIAYYINASGSNVPMEGASAVQFTLTDGEYGEADSIDEIQEEAGTAEWFDLQGRRLAAPSRGLMIRRQGNKTVKVSL